MTDPFAYWKAALEAKQKHLEIPREKYHDGQPQKPECGYYRKRTSRNGKPCWEAVAFYPQEGDVLICERQFSKPPTELQEQTELFTTVWDQPVEFDVYEAVVDNSKPWPDELDAFGLPPVDEPPENERAVIGHNEPPEKTEIERAAAIVTAAERQYDEWIKARDLVALDAASGDLLSQYIARARELKQANDKRRAELAEPHVKAQRAINAEWKPVIERCEAFQKRAARDWETYRYAAQKRAEDAARKANEEAMRIAEEERRKRAEIEGAQSVEDVPPVPVAVVQPAKVKGGVGTRISSRQRTVCVVHDAKALLAYVATLDVLPSAFEQPLQEFANRYGPGGNLPGVRVEKQTYVA